MKQAKRELVMLWWNDMSLEDQFYKTIQANHLIEGDRTRHPHTLTGLEIEKIYEYFNPTK